MTYGIGNLINESRWRLDAMVEPLVKCSRKHDENPKVHDIQKFRWGGHDRYVRPYKVLN